MTTNIEKNNNHAANAKSERSPLISGGIASITGILVLAGWYLDVPVLIQLHPAFPSVAFNAALLLVISGAGLLAYSHHPRFTMLCGGLVLAAGLLTLVQYLFGVDLQIDQLFVADRFAERMPYPGRMAPNAAFAFILAGLALLILGTPVRHKHRHMFLGITGGALAALALVSPFAYLMSGEMISSAWGSIVGPDIALHLSFGFVVIGGGLMTYAWQHGRESETATLAWLPVMVGLAALAGVLAVWQTLREQELLHAENIVKSEADSAAHIARLNLDTHVKGLLRMARRWETRGMMPKAEWEADARHYEEHIPAYRSIQWVDPGLRVRWEVPSAGVAEVKDLPEKERLALQAAGERREVTLTHELKTGDGGTERLLVYVPFASRSGFAGYMRGILDVQELFDTTLYPEVSPGYAVAVFDNGREIYRRGDDTINPSESWGRDASLNMYGTSLRVRVWPVSAHSVASLRSHVPAIVLGLGTFLSMILALTAYFAQKSRLRARLLEAANLSLTDEINGHLQALGRLEKSEQRYGQLMEHAADGIFIMDVSFDLLDVNRSGCEMIGYAREELLKFNAKNLFLTEDVAARPMRFAEVLSGRTVVIERPLLRKDGTTLPVEVSVKLIGDRVQAIIRDISERKRAEELTTRLGRMVDSTFCEIYAFDQETLRLIQANQGALSSLGYSPKELASLTFLALQPEITPEHFADLVKPLLDGHQNQVVYETLQRRKDGSPYLVEVRLQLMRNATPLLYIAVALNISARRETELQMRKLSSALEQTADLVVITDAASVIEYVNPAFEKVTGYSLDEIRGTTPRVLKSGRHDNEFYQRLWSVIRGGKAFHDVFTNRRKDGSLYYEEQTITPLKDAHGYITHFISTGKNITEHQHVQDRLLHLTQHDILTQLPNRALFIERLARAVSHTQLHQRLLAVLSLDVDGLGVINDTLGHEVGDRALQLLAERLNKCVRNQDTVARLGGDEFGIVLETVPTINELSLVIQKIRMALSMPYPVDGHEVLVTVSTGISLYPEDGEDAPTLMRNAAAAVSRAQEQGKNNYRFYQADLNARMAERLDFETGLRHALERKEFLLHYQPQMDLKTKRICGVEALLRWQHPQRGLLAPSDFLPLLEETGLIVPLGAWLLRTVCEQNSAWQATGLPAVPVAVNVSYLQLGEPDYTDQVTLILEETGLAPRFLQLEISDRILSREGQVTQETLKTLSAKGIEIVADDFILGESSLGYLKRLTVSALKIDASFMLHEPRNAEEMVIANAIISIAHRQQLRVVATGVETEFQLRFVQAAGCDVIQGHIFGLPMSAIEVTRLLQK